MLKNHPDGKLRATYLSARESDGTPKWYVVIAHPFTADDKALTGYGPRPDPDGTFRPVHAGTATAKYREKIQEKDYKADSPDILPNAAKQGLLKTIRGMTGAAHARILPDGSVEVSMRPRRGARQTLQANQVWL